MSESKLTDAERGHIRSSWAEVKKDMTGYGYSVFIKFFNKDPSAQQHFGGFKDVPLSDLNGNKALLAHAMNVMNQISDFVDNLEDRDQLLNKLVKLAEDHRVRKITPEMFDNLKVALLETLKEKLGAQLSAEAEAAWNNTYDVFMTVVKAGL